MEAEAAMICPETGLLKQDATMNAPAKKVKVKPITTHLPIVFSPNPN